jgi:hypothetical protein
MQALYELIHGMAKEEKRLYNLHGRNSRFTQIYKGYLAATEYNKSLDRDLYQKHFSTFSKAFYSMQKNALLDDILAVLLEYSNSSHEDFNVHRFRAKYEVLRYKGLHDQALHYVQAALEASEKQDQPLQRLRLLEDYRDTLALSTEATWETYEATLQQIKAVQVTLAASEQVFQMRQQLNILITSSKNTKDPEHKLQAVALETVQTLKGLAESQASPETRTAAFWAEYQYSKAFEDKYALHKRLVTMEKQAAKENFPKEVRLEAVNLLMESSLECGDFLLINGLIYKTQKELDSLTPHLRKHFLPKYLELCSIYHFYENDLTLAQKEISELIKLEDLPVEDLLRYYFHKMAILIAANLPRGASEAIAELIERIPKTDTDITVKMAELIVTINQNNREEALVRLQRLRSLLRKSTDARKLSHYRAFLDMLQKYLQKKPFSYQEISALETDWNDLLKLNLWLKSKIDNSFYYNAILSYWQGRKKILNY